ncbi:MAG: HEAT repeat domain-containing protein [Candidatus Binatia bacterium]
MSPKLRERRPLESRSRHRMMVAGVVVAIMTIMAILAIVATVFPARRTRQGAVTPASPPSSAAVQGQPQWFNQRVERRLEQLRVARALPDGETSEGIDAPSNVPAPPIRPADDSGTEEDVAAEGDPDDIPTLTLIALRDADPARRLGAVTLLGALGDPQVIPILEQTLTDEDQDVRVAAIESLSDFDGDAPVAALERALQDRSADVRYEAVNVLADIGSDRARHAIATTLNDPDGDVRALAEGALDLARLNEGAPAAAEGASAGHAR